MPLKFLPPKFLPPKFLPPKFLPSRARLLGGLSELFQRPAAPGLTLMAAAAVAFVLANSPLSWAPHALFDVRLSVGVGGATLEKTLHHWINDGLMALFFLMVGLEVKREIIHGSLSSLRKAALPVAAALGGMLLPAAIFASINTGGPGAAGWAIPMATDIAFALGVLALLGDRVPLSLKVFLAAVAVADDVGAVAVIALFYTSKLSLLALGVALLLTVALFVLNRLRVQNLGVYLAVGALLWLAVLNSGIHATIAGVVLAMAVPLTGPEGSDHSPLVHLEHTLHPWVSWLVLPVFALANAGVTVVGTEINLGDPLVIGVVAGLLVGKSVGIPAMCWIVVRLGLGELPQGATFTHVVGVGLIAGIGFTMSIFVAGLAFVDPLILDAAKVGILGGSFISGSAGVALLWWAGPVGPDRAAAAPPTA